VRKLALAIAIALVLVVGGYMFFKNPVCHPQEARLTSNRYGLVVRMVRKSCDTIAKEDITEVYLSRLGGQDENLVFAYDPEEQTYPSIKILGDHSIEISVSSLSSISFQASHWKDMKIRYRVGHIQYPAPRRGA
jgi:hypothetical protein